MGRGRTKPIKPLSYNYIDIDVYGDMEKKNVQFYYNSYYFIFFYLP
jgi:hypothetical protein